MEDGKSPGWLPPGWTELVELKNGRNVKYYSNLETGQKFYSKNDVIRYVTMENMCRNTSQPESKHKKRSSKNKTMPLGEISTKTPEWLPQGWIMEVKIRSSGSRIGQKYKCYIDPLTGSKFYSKPEVYAYLKTAKLNSCASPQKETEEDTVINPNMDESTGGKTFKEPEVSPDLGTANVMSCTPEKKQVGNGKQSVVIERVTPTGLPPGWIKEIKIEKKGNRIRKDPYYTDPVSGYVFRSQKDALRYLETGDVDKCSMKPKKREKMEFLDKETSGSPNKGESVRGGTSSGQEGPQNMKAGNNSRTPKRKKVGFDKQSANKGESIGGETSSGQEGPQNMKAQNTSHTPRRKEVGLDKQSVAVKRVTPNGLPPGSIKEKNMAKKASRTRKKPPNVGKLTGGKTSMMLKGSRNLKTAEGMSSGSKQMKTDISEQSAKKVVIERVTADGLPSGWIKEVRIEMTKDKTRRDPYYTDPTSGYVFHSQKDALRYLETGDLNSCNKKPRKRDELKFLSEQASPSMGELTAAKNVQKQVGRRNLDTVKATSGVSKQKQTDKRFVKKVAIERVAPDGLPAGWIKEIKIQKKANGIRKDPYYTDPVSGYVFRSQKDALRYLETGDASMCAIKPKKRAELGFLVEEDYLPSDGSMQKSGHRATRRRLFTGTGSGVTSSLETKDAGSSRKRKSKRISVDSKVASTPAADVLERNYPVDQEAEECAGVKENNNTSSTPLPRTENSKRKKRKVVFAENGNVTNPKIMQEEKLAESGNAENGNRKSAVNSRKSNKKREFSLPSRSSKRLAGLNPDMVVNLVLSELALTDEAEKSSECEAKASLGALENVAQSPDKPHSGLEMETETAHHVFTGKEGPSAVEPSNNGNKPQQDQAVEEAPAPYSFGDSWSDPCLEFAFKTLTGAIAVDGVGIHGDLQEQVDISHAQKDGSSAIPDLSSPNFFPTDSDAPGNLGSSPQGAAKPTFLPSENVSLPK